MKRWTWIALVALLCAGCSSGPEVVGDVDDEIVEKMSRFEVSEKEVHFEAEGTRIYGTLTRPAGKDDAPGVILIAGSGPTDRDWNNPLLPGDNGTAIELSTRLAQAGVASLRYDKRGTGRTELSGAITWEDYLAEVKAAKNTLAADENVDAGRIFVAGHSEGGAHALRAVAEQWIEVRGVMLLATPGRPTDRLVLDQVGEQLEEAGMSSEAVESELSSLASAMDTIARGQSVEASRVSEIPGLVALVQTLQTEDAEQFAAELLGWNPTRAIARIDRPMLIVQGLKDTQVDPDEDARRLYDAAHKHNEDVELALVEDADHVLKHQPIPREELGGQFALTYNDPTRRLDEAVLTTMVSWIYER